MRTLDYPERSSGGGDMRVSPNDGTEVVRLTFWSATLPHVNSHSRRHSGTGLSSQVIIIDVRV